MSNVDYCVGHIVNAIPNEILTQVFVNHQVYGFGDMYSLEELITQKVMADRVLVDLNMIGGQEVLVPLWKLSYQLLDNGYLYKIPFSMTNGRHITSALAIESGHIQSQPGGLRGAMTGTMSTGTAEVQVVGKNVVVISEQVSMGNLYLRCRIGNETSLMNWNSSSLPKVANFSILAAKSICYNKLSIRLGDANINGGAVNSYLREAVDSMRDAQELYMEMLDQKMIKASIFQDAKSKRRATRSIMPSIF